MAANESDDAWECSFDREADVRRRIEHEENEARLFFRQLEIERALWSSDALFQLDADLRHLRSNRNSLMIAYEEINARLREHNKWVRIQRDRLRARFITPSRFPELIPVEPSHPPRCKTCSKFFTIPDAVNEQISICTDCGEIRCNHCAATHSH